MSNSPDKTITDLGRFFLSPSNSTHRQYEALRAFYVDGLSSKEAALRFGYSPGSFRVLCYQFRQNPRRAFFLPPQKGPKLAPKVDRVREKVIGLRKQNLSIYDISRSLKESGHTLSPASISITLKEEGFARLPRRRDDERPSAVRPSVAEVADVRQIDLSPRHFRTKFGGLFLFLPYLASVPFDRILNQAGFPGTQMVPAGHAMRSLLALKLFGSARHSHVMSHVFDDGLALFAGLNVIPKRAFLTEYSSYHGDDALVEKHYISKRSRRQKGILAFLAQDGDKRVFCYANADLRKDEQNDEILRFVQFWKRRTGKLPEELVFDSKLTTQANLHKLNKKGIAFITLRRRSKKMLQAIHQVPLSAWRRIELERVSRIYRTPRILDKKIKLKDYEGNIRQITVADLGHEEPTLLLTNQLRRSPAKLIGRYAQRMLIENGIADGIDFFHMDALSSAVAMKVNCDLQLTLMASSLYRLLGSKIGNGYETAKSRHIFRDFVDATALIGIDERNIVVRFQKRAHNPLLLAAGFNNLEVKVPWLANRRLIFIFG
jgi:hypothetical protein